MCLYSPCAHLSLLSVHRNVDKCMCAFVICPGVRDALLAAACVCVPYVCARFCVPIFSPASRDPSFARQMLQKLGVTCVLTVSARSLNNILAK